MSCLICITRRCDANFAITLTVKKMTTSCHHHTVDLMVWQWPKTSTNGTTGSILHMTWAFVEDLSYKNLPEQIWACSCSSCTKSYQSAITIWQRTNYSTQLLLISCQHYTALWIEMKRAAGFWRSFYVMSDVLIGELDELDLTLVASTSQSYNLPTQ